MFDWLGSRGGRLTAFFLLYVTEGIPLGYTAVFVATLMRREGVSPAVIGAFTASLYLPWSFKWVAGPFVDLFKSRRLGPRRAWIVGTQAAMSLGLLGCAGLDVTDVAKFTWFVVASNIFGAIQDVAIDALAVDTLHEKERGLANGLMFAGASVGQAVGGSGALFLLKYFGFAGSTGFVVVCLFAVLGLVSLWLRERPIVVTPAGADELSARGEATGGGYLFRTAVSEVVRYFRTAFLAFFGSKLSLIGLAVALLPAGGLALGLALQTNISVELGLNDDQVGLLNLASTLVFAVFCAAGGFLSDRFGRLRSLALFIGLTAVPTIWFAWMLWHADWIMPVEPNAAGRPVPPNWLIASLWAATLAFNAANGLMYGTRSAFYMDFCDPKVGATQFTGYMAMMNLTTSYTLLWQGFSIEHWGYPTTLLLDALFGLVCLPLLAVAARLPMPRRGLPPTDAAIDATDCPLCGAFVPAGSRHCPHCGERLPVTVTP